LRALGLGADPRVEEVRAHDVDNILFDAVLAYCLMPNHFHLVLWPHADGDLSRFMR
jgi:REP element-mobilizing transposase RayT